MDIIVCIKQNVDMKQIRIKKDTREAVLEGLPGVHGGYVEAYSNPDGTDRIVVHAAVREDSLTTLRLADELRARLRVTPQVEATATRACSSEYTLSSTVSTPGKAKADASASKATPVFWSSRMVDTPGCQRPGTGT